jgi:hypothetical protein
LRSRRSRLITVWSTSARCASLPSREAGSSDQWWRRIIIGTRPISMRMMAGGVLWCHQRGLYGQHRYRGGANV